MSARVCERCQYNVLSQVVTTCPNCGTPLPRRANSARLLMAVVSFAFLALLAAGGITIVREAVRRAEAPPPGGMEAPVRPPSTTPARAVPSPATGASPSAAGRAVAAALVAELGASEPQRRRQAAESLAEAGDRAAAGPLLKALTDRDDTVRQLATYALVRMCARGAVPPNGRPAVAAAIRPLLDDRYALARSTAAYALGELRDRSAVPGLLRLLGDPSVTVRAMSATALGDLKEPRAVRRLVPLLSEEATVGSAARALGEIGTAEAERVLMDAYAKRNLDVVAGAHAFYLRRKVPGYRETLLELLANRNDLGIAQSLIQSGDPQLVGPARKWAADQGWALVNDPKSPTGVTWQAAAPR